MCDCAVARVECSMNVDKVLLVDGVSEFLCPC